MTATLKVEDATPTESAADPQHPRHAQWVKQSLIEDEAKWASARGVIPNMRKIESEWVTTLERLGREKRTANPGRRDSAKKAAEKLNMRFEKGVERQLGRDVSVAKALQQASPTTRAMYKRVRQIMAITPRGAGKDPTPVYPYFCKQVANAYVQFYAGSGDFRGKLKADREKILHRKLENVADMSRGVLGDWRP